MPRRGQITGRDFPYRKNPDGHPLCRFCGAGVPHPRRCWCSEACVQAYLVITNPSTRMRRLVQARFGSYDKATCAHCNRTDRQFQQDHAAPGFGAPIPWVPTIAEVAREARRPWTDYNAALELDHIVELADGGCWWSTWNLQLLCRDCHKLKSAESRRRRARSSPKPPRRRSARSPQG